MARDSEIGLDLLLDVSGLLWLLFFLWESCLGCFVVSLCLPASPPLHSSYNHRFIEWWWLRSAAVPEILLL
ncbi:hypothetical protein RchiOBHm_Chr2g0170991 [Rosa chinensis]|uniref:Uncharacterized protein n=1 Tax=Rosa chinensis TaxID=74649 RepID=A0A2P6S593_ROSCH|nr:hypothetical protein RchiOBHm_Chr2g0170991 [Rosa chinensis]